MPGSAEKERSPGVAIWQWNWLCDDDSLYVGTMSLL